MLQLILAITTALWISACSQKQVAPITRTETSAKADKAACERFDKFIFGRLAPEEEQRFREGCLKTPPESPFCESAAKGDALLKRARNRLKAPKPVVVKHIKPFVVKIENAKVTNWKRVRSAPVKALLKGMEGLSLEDLAVVKKAAVKEKRCPNNAAVVVAATLEDYLPDRAEGNEIAGLYEKAGDCVRGQPADREHYLTRSGLLHFQRKEYKIAYFYFDKATKAEPTSRGMYWLYRAYEALGDKESAKKSLDNLISRFPLAFHSLVAATANGRDPGEFLKSAAVPATMTRSQKVPSLNPLIEESEALKECGLDATAGLVADFALEEAGKAESEVRLYLSQLGGAASRITYGGDLLNRVPPVVNRFVLDLFFPRMFFPTFEKHSGALDPYILMSISRQESTFNDKAVSPANAQGLMQIHPDTSIKLTAGKEVDLFDPDVSVELGARYLTDLMKRFGKIHLVLAAYNAGEEKLAVWQSRYQTKDPVLFIDLISYRETRNYVATVLRNFYWYRRLSGAESQMVARVIDPEVAKK